MKKRVYEMTSQHHGAGQTQHEASTEPQTLGVVGHGMDEERIRTTARKALEAKDDQLIANMKRNEATEKYLKDRVAKLQEDLQHKNSEVRSATCHT